MVVEPLELRVSCRHIAVAEEIARAALEARLIANANMIDVTSLYRWEGEIRKVPEVILMVRTTRARVDALAHLIREMHPYDLPAISWKPIEADAETRAWITRETGG